MKSSIQLVLVALGLFFSGCNNEAEKINAYNEVVSTSTFQDTAINYSLFSDSLVLEFAKEPEMKHWYGEIFLVKTDPDHEVHIPFPNKTTENMGRITITEKKLTFSGFHISPDSLHRYRVHFHAVPTLPGFHSIGDIYGPMYLFNSNPNGSNKLEVNDLVHDFTITSFDLVKLKKMSPELSDFCRDSIENAFNTTFTDVEIEESSYGF